MQIMQGVTYVFFEICLSNTDNLLKIHLAQYLVWSWLRKLIVQINDTAMVAK